MNLTELEEFLEKSDWDEDPLPAQVLDSAEWTIPKPTTEQPQWQREQGTQIAGQGTSSKLTSPVDISLATSEPVFRVAKPAVKLVPKSSPLAPQAEPEVRSMRERLQEVEMAQKMGYLLCKCTWPPQIMVLTGADHIYRCCRCSRVREM